MTNLDVVQLLFLLNHRDVCMAAEAGYAEFKGLTGHF